MRFQQRSRSLPSSLLDYQRTGVPTKLLKSKKWMTVCVTAAALIIVLVNTNIHQNQRLLEDHQQMVEQSGDEIRDLITDMVEYGVDGTECDIGNPTEDADPAPEGTTKTLLTSYPGSGKRFTWTILKALTNGEVADDWNYSEKLNNNPMFVKTSWPHKEGIWSWDTQMDQVILLLRNPRWAIPSYHNMRFELDYAKDYASSLIRIPDTYTERPAMEDWEKWRDEFFDTEIDRWVNYVEFWVQGGFLEYTNGTHPNCLNRELDCHPKAIIDFGHFYQENPTTEFSKITQVLDTSTDVEVIAAKARACVLDKVFERSELHNANRPFSPQYLFTVEQLDKIMNRTVELIDKFSEEPHSLEYVAPELVNLLNKYLEDNYAEHDTALRALLSDWIEGTYGTTDCSTLAEADEVKSKVCDSMKVFANHDLFMPDRYYPDNFLYSDWLNERSILMGMYHSTSLSSDYPNWLNPADHCLWTGVTCNIDSLVTSIELENINIPLSGPFPPGLDGLRELTTLSLSTNRFTGLVYNDICGDNDISITGDETNCPNDLDNPGCCNSVKLTNPSPYLDQIVASKLGSSDCASLASQSDIATCNWMKNRDNHSIFLTYPDGFPYRNWLEQRLVLAQLYYSTSFNTDYPNWLNESNHCSWNGVGCDGNTNLVESLIIKDLSLTGPFPNNLNDLSSLTSLITKGNDFDGLISTDICDMSGIDIVGDESNCPNAPDPSGANPPGCCIW